MRIPWRPRNAQVSVILVAGLAAVAGTVLPGRVCLAATVTATPTATVTATPTATATTHVRAPHQATRPRPPAGPALTISVSDGRAAADPGEQLTYTVSVRDGGTVGARHLKITQTLSAGLDFLSASPRGTAGGGQIAWSAAIPAGGTRTFRVTARVTRTPAGLLRLAAVACASDEGSSRPIVCAAHLDRLPAATAASASRVAGPAGPGPLPYAAAAVAVLAAVVLAVIARRRIRLRRRPADQS